MTVVRVGDVWDRTVDVLRGRGGILAGIAIATMVLPGVLVGALGTVVPLPDGAAVAVPVIRLAVVVLLILGVLAITAVASDPSVDRAQGLGIAGRRLLPAFGVLMLLVLAGALLVLAAGALLALSGFTVTRQGTFDMSHATTGATVGAGVALLVGVALALWISARMVPLFAIVVNERRGAGALRRSFDLTRGSTMRLIGVLILYFVVLAVVMLAVSSVTGVVARLLLGGDAAGTVQFVLGVVGSLISAAATAVQSVFYARFYVAAVEHEQRMAPLA